MIKRGDSMQEQSSKPEEPRKPEDAQKTNGTVRPEGTYGSEKGALSRKQLVFAAIAALLCVVLIGGSAWSLMSGGAAPGALPAQESTADGSDPSHAGAPDGGTSDEAHDEGDPKEAEGDSDSGPSDGKKQDSSVYAGGKDEGSSGVNSSGKPVSSTQDSSLGQGSSGGSGGGANAQVPAAPEPRTVTVSISADATVGGGGTAGPVTLTLEEGATVYDALAGAGWPIASEWTAMGVYVTSINGIAAGPKTGWTYAVNGALPNYACSAYALSDGDAITWKFVEVK